MAAFSWYRATPDAARIPPAVAQRALEWLMTLQGDDVTPQTRDAWLRWRTAHPDHERAWQRIESVQNRLQPLATPVTADIARAALMPSSSPPSSRGRRHAMKALATLAFAGGMTYAARDMSPWRQWAADYRTAVGEQRHLTLADGTSLSLNTDSAVDILYSDTERRVKLLGGEILVVTAKDPHATPRPFLVETAQGTARALGTRYVVQQHDADTEICVFDGAVEIRPRRNANRALVVQAGACTRYTDDDIDAPGAAQAGRMAWAEGFIVARSMRLDDFIAQLARYSRATLSCDADVAGLRVSGSFPLDDVGKVIDTLSTTLNLHKVLVTRLWGPDEIRLAANRRG